MTLANCTECGTVFVKSMENVCPKCVRARENDLEKIRNWISAKEYPMLSNIEFETGISEKLFKKYLLDGRIKAFKKVVAICEMCGHQTNLETKSIICNGCRNSLKKASGVVEKKELQDTELYSKTKKSYDKFKFKKPD